jgi:hypothetical protein
MASVVPYPRIGRWGEAPLSMWRGHLTHDHWHLGGIIDELQIKHRRLDENSDEPHARPAQESRNNGGDAHRLTIGVSRLRNDDLQSLA